MLFGNEKHVVSASRRTDLPAFHAEWFVNRVRQGYCKVANPCYPSQVKEVSLRPDDVAAFVFWTRFSGPLQPWLEELDARGFNYYFLYTMTGYPSRMEPGLPDLECAIEDFLGLAGRIGAEKVIWRYDPLVMTPVLDWRYHRENFRKLARSLSGGTNRVIITFLKQYRHIAGAMSELGGATPDRREQQELESAFRETAERFGMTLRGCGQRESFPGPAPSKCIDEALLRKLFGLELSARKDRGQPVECRCIRSVDIGSYGTCLHGCVYCYASRDFSRAGRRCRESDVMREML